jgi:hypothetical protein
MITVTTPAQKFNLIDLGVVRDVLEVDGTDQDAALQGIIDRASDVIARHCRRVFARETVTEQFRLERVEMDLILSRFPVTALTSVTEGSAMLTASDYELNLDTGIIMRLSNDQPTFWSLQKIIVTYSAGFDLPAGAPDALQQAALQLVKAYYLGADRDPLIRAESVTPMSSASYFGGSDYLPPDVVGLLGPFRNVRMR